MSQTRLVHVIAQSIVFHIDNYIYKKMSYTTKLILLNYGNYIGGSLFSCIFLTEMAEKLHATSRAVKQSEKTG